VLAPSRTSSNTIGMKAAISLPDELFQRAEAEAARLGVSRSKLVQCALEEYLSARRDAHVTRELDLAIAKHGNYSSGEDAAWVEHSTQQAREALARDEWKE